LFDVVGPKIGDRPGGYLRVIKTGFRRSDASDMAIIEFVDFNDLYNQGAETKTDSKRRRRGRGGKAKTEATPAATTTTTEVVEATEEIATEAEDKE